MKKILLFLLIIICGTAQLFGYKIRNKPNNTHTVLDKPLSIEEALKIAYDQRSSLKALKKAILVQYNNKLVALSGYLPQANLSTAWTKSIRNVFATQQTNFSFSQLIYSFAGPLQEYKVANQNVKIARLQETLNENQIQFETEESILELWNQQKRESTIAALEYATTEQFDRAQQQNYLGLLSDNQWLEEQALNAENLATVFQYPDILKRALSDFERAIEQPLPTALLNKADLHAFIQERITQSQQYPLNYYLKHAMRNRKELPIKDNEIKREKYLQQLYERSYLPSTSLFVNITKGGTDSQFTGGGSSTFWLTGVQINIPFDGLGNVHRSNAAHASMMQKMAEKVNTMQNIELEVKTAHLELQELFKQLDAAQVRLDQEATEYDLRQTQFEVGEISQVELASAERTWQDAQFTLENLQIKTAQKERELQFRCGYPETHNNHYKSYGRS